MAEAGPQLRVVPPRSPRFHLLLCRGGSRTDFSELVCASELTAEENGWHATAESPLTVSSVEVDARLARWSRRSEGLAVRITRTDDLRWWLAVHYAGQRLLVLIYSQDEDGVEAERASLASPELGRDPLLDLLRGPGMATDTVRAEVARQRAVQLEAALAQGDVTVDPESLEGILGAPESSSNGNLAVLLDLLGAPNALALTAELTATAPTPVGPLNLQRMLGRVLVVGCLLPTIVGTTLFVVVSRLAARAGLGPLLALVAGMGAGWIGLTATRQLARRFGSGEGWQQRMNLSWAAEKPPNGFRPVRPTARALNTWGGLFYLLRDIAFFGGIDRPHGPMSLYLEAWGIGPPGLVAAINRAVEEESRSAPLFDVAESLVRLRAELIDQHLAGERIAPGRIQDEVKQILRPAVSS